MELRHLRYAVELARTMHFTQAADALGVAQPALSQAIAALERELAITLFDRTSRRVQLTGAGALFIERAQRILGDVEHLQSQMQEHSAAVRGRVTIGTMLHFGQTRLPPIVAEFSRIHPGIEVVLHNDSMHGGLDRLRAGTMDVAFFNIAEPAGYPDLEFVAVETDEIVAVLPSEHRFAGRARIRFAELESEPFVAYQPGSTMHEAFTTLAREAGFAPRVAVRSRSTMLVRALVSAGIGVSTGSKAYCASPGPPIAAIPLTPPMPIAISMAYRPASETNPPARALLAFLREQFALDTPGEQ